LREPVIIGNRVYVVDGPDPSPGQGALLSLVAQ
jgi:hypothetical protein